MTITVPYLSTIQDAVDSITDSFAKMAAVTDPNVLETTYKEVWTQSEDVLLPSHPERLKVLQSKNALDYFLCPLEEKLHTCTVNVVLLLSHCDIYAKKMSPFLCMFNILQVLERLVNNYIKQKKFKEGREFLSPVMDKLLVIGADHSAMMRVELLMHNIKEE